MTRALTFVLMALLLAGCNVLPSQLSSRLHALPYIESASRAACAASFSIRDLRLAGHLDRAEVVTGHSGSLIEVSPLDLWASPLKDELRRALGHGLAARWIGARLVSHPWRFGETPDLALEVSVDRLEPIGHELQANIRWQWWTPATPARQPFAVGSLSRSLRLPDSSASATVLAISQVVEATADALAAQGSDQVALAALCRR